jgi:hypothetical protein
VDNEDEVEQPMYKDFFGFDRNPFELSPNPSFMCSMEKSNAALASIMYATVSSREDAHSSASTIRVKSDSHNSATTTSEKNG